MLQFRAEVLAADIILHVEGDLDIEAIGRFRDWLFSVIEHAPAVVVLESAAVDCTHDSAVAALVDLAFELQSRGGHLQLLNPAIRLVRDLRFADPDGIIQFLTR